MKAPTTLAPLSGRYPVSRSFKAPASPSREFSLTVALHFVVEMFADVLAKAILDGRLDLKEFEPEVVPLDPADDGAFHTNRPSMVREKNRQAEPHSLLQRDGAGSAAPAGRQIRYPRLNLEVVLPEQEDAAIDADSAPAAIFLRHRRPHWR